MDRVTAAPFNADDTRMETVRLLVVDDDDKIRTSLRRGLAYEGYRVVEAPSGEEALEKAR